MKKLLIPFLLLSLAACSGKEEKKQEDGLLSTDIVKNPHSASGVDTSSLASMATMDFSDTTHNFGRITEGEKVVHEFSYTNNGKTPLIISSAQGSCGCTVPDYSRQPTAPGASGVIKVEFNSADKPGHQEKTVVINTNSNRGVHVLHISADVTAAK